MTQVEFSQFLAQRGCIGENNHYCGSFQHLPFSVAFSGGKANKRTSALVQFQFSQSIPHSIYKEIQKALKPWLLRNTYATNHNPTILAFTLTAKTDADFATLFDSALQLVATLAARYSLTPPATCPLCHNTMCDSYAYLNGTYRPAHAACVHAMSMNEHAKASHNMVSGSYASGILGALLGALIGCLPTILTLLLFSRAFVVLYALIPLCAFQGYKILRGKMSKGTFWIISIISLLISPFTDLGTLYIIVLRDYGYRLTFIETLMFITEPDLWGTIALSFIFTLLGIAIVSGTIRRNNQTALVDSAFAVNSLRPIAGITPPTAPAMTISMDAAPASADATPIIATRDATTPSSEAAQD